MASPFPPSSASYARPQSYAPTPYNYMPSSSLGATISVDQEVSLPSNASERDTLESLAELYSIIVTLDDLEKAFTRGSVSESEYTTLCGTMIRQYREILKQDRVAREFGNLERFQREWEVSSSLNYRPLLANPPLCCDDQPLLCSFLTSHGRYNTTKHTIKNLTAPLCNPSYWRIRKTKSDLNC